MSKAKVTHYTDIEAVEFGPTAPGAKIRVLIDDEHDGAPVYKLRMIEIDPGGNSPDHSHPYEHENFVIKGQGQVMIGDVFQHLGANDHVEYGVAEGQATRVGGGQEPPAAPVRADTVVKVQTLTRRLQIVRIDVHPDRPAAGQGIGGRHVASTAASDVEDAAPGRQAEALKRDGMHRWPPGMRQRF